MTYELILDKLEQYTEVLDTAKLSQNLEYFEYKQDGDALDQIALGITYHEICVVHYILGKDKSYAHYAEKALRTLVDAKKTSPVDAYPILDTYINSSRSLVASTKNNLVELIRVIRIYNGLVRKYGSISYYPEFLEGSLLENLPNILGGHTKAKKLFESIIAKHESDPAYASDKIVSFCYLSLGKLEKNSTRKKDYFQKSIAIDADKQGGANQALAMLQANT
jgi:hypothetical protein